MESRRVLEKRAASVQLVVERECDQLRALAIAIEDHAEALPFRHRSQAPWLRAQAAAIARSADLLGEAFHRNDKDAFASARGFLVASVIGIRALIGFGADVAGLEPAAAKAISAIHSRLVDVEGSLPEQHPAITVWLTAAEPSTDIGGPGERLDPPVGDAARATPRRLPSEAQLHERLARAHELRAKAARSIELLDDGTFGGWLNDEEFAELKTEYENELRVHDSQVQWLEKVLGMAQQVTED